jgi:uncharacterized BrkB/YihY/UPF0761 family membrane protein
MTTKESLRTIINKYCTRFNNAYTIYKPNSFWHNVISVIVILILLFLVALPFWIYFKYVQEKITNKNYDNGIIAALCINFALLLACSVYYINRKIKPKEEKKRQPKPRIGNIIKPPSETVIPTIEDSTSEQDNQLTS